MKNSIRLFLTLLFLLSCDNKNYETCVSKGINYFKDIGSFPTLSDGRNAKKIAEQRCLNTTGAFNY